MRMLDLLCKTLCSVKLEYFCEDKDDQIKRALLLSKAFCFVWLHLPVNFILGTSSLIHNEWSSV